MIKYLPLLLLFACADKKPNPRPLIEMQQKEIMGEIKRLRDSSANNPSPSASNMSETEMDSIAKAEGAVIRRIVHLQMKYDSLANIMKQYKADSILKSK